jgi:hypothetical protein
VVFIEHLEEVGFLSCLVSIFIYIAYLGLELISVVISSIVVYPIPCSDFPRNTPLGHRIIKGALADYWVASNVVGGKSRGIPY